MKTCPECGSHNVIMFDSDNDFCNQCDNWFPAVKEIPDGIDRIAAERQRQIDVEGYDAEHDRQHSADDLARAAATYATGLFATLWPWAPEWWNPSSDRIRNLEKAGALIAAAIDRIQAEGK